MQGSRHTKRRTRKRLAVNTNKKIKKITEYEERMRRNKKIIGLQGSISKNVSCKEVGTRNEETIRDSLAITRRRRGKEENMAKED